MMFFLTNPEILEGIGRRGQDYVIENYAEDVIVQKWYALFKKLEDKKGIT